MDTLILRFFSLLFICSLSLIGKQALADEVLLSKNQLECLYNQIDDLLQEDDPVIAILSDDYCNEQQNRLSMNDERGLPIIDPTVDPNKNQEIIILTRKQLNCYKSAFKKLITDSRNEVPVNFRNICTTYGETVKK